ncbi:MAG: sigma-70 family RNA polymerase sigma factor [Candidatus Sulfotelmatobacter sp.]|jgi:RNA polymerase sigma factor (sigma-70 family)
MKPAPGKTKKVRTNQFSDATLVKECLQGGEAAWSTLVEKYKNLIYSIPVRFGFSQEDSADIFQTVCLDLLNELPRLREPNALAGWLIQVTRNKCFHKKQAQLRYGETELDDSASQESMTEPEDLIAQVQREQMVREALLELAPRCQKLVQMLFFDMPARPYESVAKDLGIALGSVGFIRKRCLEKLRVLLERIGE